MDAAVGSDDDAELPGASSRPGSESFPLVETRRLALFAEETFAERRRTAFGCCCPRAVDPRRIMTHMLRMTALQVRHPVTLIVLMEPDDLSFDAAHLNN